MANRVWSMLAVGLLAACSGDGGGTTGTGSEAAPGTPAATTTAAPATTTTTGAAVASTTTVPWPAGAPTAYEQVLDDIERDGEVTLPAALAAFSAVFGDLPGAAVPAGPREPALGGAALRWIQRFWPDLTTEQRDAVVARLGFEPVLEGGVVAGLRAEARRGPGACQPVSWESSPDAGPYLEVFNRVVTTLDGLVGNLFSGRTLPGKTMVRLCTTKAVGQENAWAVASSYFDDGGYAGCGMYVYPEAQSLSGNDLLAVVTHEVWHCYEAALVGDAQAYGAAPGWLVEGSASWIGEHVGGGPSRVAVGHWGSWLAKPGVDLLVRNYSAIGFWATVAADAGDATTVSAIVAGLLAKGTSQADFDAVMGAAGDGTYRLWASRYFRVAELPAWDTTGAGVPAASVAPAPKVDAVASGATVTAAPRTAALATLPTDGDLTIVTATGVARVSSATSVDAVVDGAFTGCNRPDGCECPEGKVAPGPITQLAGPPVRLAVTGTNTASEATVITMRLQDWCEPEPGAHSGRDACELLPPDEVAAATGIALPPVLARDVTALDSCLFNDGSGAPPSWAVQASFVDPPLTSLPAADVASVDCAAFGGGYVDGPGYYACVPDLPGIFVRTVNGTAMITTTESYTHDQALALVQIVVGHL